MRAHRTKSSACKLRIKGVGSKTMVNCAMGEFLVQQNKVFLRNGRPFVPPITPALASFTSNTNPPASLALAGG
jgi:hypothetical protein